MDAYDSRFSLALLAAVLIGACTTSDMQAYTPVKEKTGHSEQNLRDAAFQALEAQGYSAFSSDAQPTVLETREKEVFVSSVPRLAYRYTFRVDTKGGVLSIETTCKKNSAMERQEYEECGEERPKRVMDEQQKLRDGILERAKTKKSR